MKTPLPPLNTWQRLLLVLLALAMIAGVELLLRNEQARLSALSQQQQLAAADQVRTRLEKELNIPLYLTASLASYLMAKSGQLETQELDILLAGLVRQSSYIRNIGIAPGNRILHVYPLAGNEQAINLYYPDLPLQWPAIASMISSRRALLSGPLDLVQGGRGFIYRYPLYLEDDSYWGIISTVIDLAPIWQLLTNSAKELGIEVALRGLTAEGEVTPAFFGEQQLFNPRSLQLNVAIRGAEWQMAVKEAPVTGSRLTLLRLGLYATALCILYLLSRLLATVYRLRHSRDALTESEQRLRSIYDNVLDGIITVDRSGRIQTANSACSRIFGYKADALLGQKWSFLLANAQQVEQQIEQQVQQTNPEQQQLECQGLRADGQSFELLLFHTPMPQANYYKLLVLRDITERKRIERLQNDFVATVSHELRTPLTSINGALSLAVGGALGPLSTQQQKMLEIAQHNCRQLHQLVNDLLDFEKLSSGNMPLKILPFDLLPLLQQLSQQLASSQQRQFELKADAATYPVLADEARVRQVCLNLLSNALKFAEPDTPITLQLLKHSQQVELQVDDIGKGVPAAFEPMLFQRFAQADSASSRAQSGTGLGLAISKQLIDKMHGDIGYQRLANGSRFFIRLPLASS